MRTRKPGRRQEQRAPTRPATGPTPEETRAPPAPAPAPVPRPRPRATAGRCPHGLGERRATMPSGRVSSSPSSRSTCRHPMGRGPSRNPRPPRPRRPSHRWICWPSSPTPHPRRRPSAGPCCAASRCGRRSCCSSPGPTSAPSCYVRSPPPTSPPPRALTPSTGNFPSPGPPRAREPSASPAPATSVRSATRTPSPRPAWPR